MACNTLSGIQLGCDNNAGGLTKFYIAQYESVTGLTVVDNVVTSISLSGGTPAFYEFEFNKNSAQFVETGNIDLVNGSSFFTVETTLNIARRDAAKSLAIQSLSAGQQKLLIIVKDANGIYWLQGRNEGVNLTAVGEGSGLAKADGSKYSLTFTSEEPDMMPEFSSGLISAILV